jgi:diguanylate cyclase (GGDEF)-like protein
MTEIQASEYSSRLVQNIEKLHIPHKGSPLGYVTISVGYSQLTPQANLDSNLIIDQADRALYAAKANGKNVALAYKQH